MTVTLWGRIYLYFIDVGAGELSQDPHVGESASSASEQAAPVNPGQLRGKQLYASLYSKHCRSQIKPNQTKATISKKGLHSMGTVVNNTVLQI